MRKSDELKTPYRDGTTHVIFEPLDFLARFGRPGAEAKSQPDALPWGIRTQQQAPCCGDDGAAG